MKTSNTRKQRAKELLIRLKDGPLPDILEGKEISKDHYGLWVETWIIPEIIDLIPELRKNKPFQKRKC